LDTNVRTSLTYTVANKEILEPIYEVFDADYTRNTMDLKKNVYDGYVTEIRDNSIIFKQVKYGNELGSYLIHTKTTENGVSLFRENESIRIIEDFSISHEIVDNIEVIKNFNGVYYLNKLMVTKDFGTSAYYTANQINAAMEAVYNSGSIYDECTWLHFYYDEAKAIDLLKTRYGDLDSVDEKIVIFMDALPSRRLAAQKYFSTEVKEYGHSVKDAKDFPNK